MLCTVRVPGSREFTFYGDTVGIWVPTRDNPTEYYKLRRVQYRGYLPRFGIALEISATTRKRWGIRRSVQTRSHCQWQREVMYHGSWEQVKVARIPGSENINTTHVLAGLVNILSFGLSFCEKPACVKKWEILWTFELNYISYFILFEISGCVSLLDQQNLCCGVKIDKEKVF